MGDRRKIQEGGDICIPMADSCWCTAETNAIWQSNYPPIKNRFFKKEKIFIKMLGIRVTFPIVFKNYINTNITNNTNTNININITNNTQIIQI